jgi:hypothetical protein
VETANHQIDQIDDDTGVGSWNCNGVVAKHRSGLVISASEEWTRAYDRDERRRLAFAV